MKREYKLFVEGMDFNKFRSDEKTIYAVTRSLEIIGEAVNHVPDEVKKKYPKIPWKDIKNLRNKIIHKYWGVDLEIVWDIIENEIGDLEKNLKLIK